MSQEIVDAVRNVFLITKDGPIRMMDQVCLLRVFNESAERDIQT